MNGGYTWCSTSVSVSVSNTGMVHAPTLAIMIDPACGTEYSVLDALAGVR